MQTDIRCPSLWNNQTLMPKILSSIFYKLDLPSLGAIRQVCQSWQETAADPYLEKTIIYHTTAFSSQQWEKYGEEIIQIHDKQDSELESLPNNMSEIFMRHFPEKKGKIVSLCAYRLIFH